MSVLFFLFVLSATMTAAGPNKKKVGGALAKFGKIAATTGVATLTGMAAGQTPAQALVGAGLQTATGLLSPPPGTPVAGPPPPPYTPPVPVGGAGFVGGLSPAQLDAIAAVVAAKAAAPTTGVLPATVLPATGAAPGTVLPATGAAPATVLPATVLPATGAVLRGTGGATAPMVVPQAHALHDDILYDVYYDDDDVAEHSSFGGYGYETYDGFKSDGVSLILLIFLFSAICAIPGCVCGCGGIVVGFVIRNQVEARQQQKFLIEPRFEEV